MRLSAKKTKIVCTIGPATKSRETLEQMIRKGMNVARLNFSHGDFDDHRGLIANIRAAAIAVGQRVAVLADLPGPKMRIGRLARETVELKRDRVFALVTGDFEGDAGRVSINFSGLPKVVRPGDQILISDGLIQLEVEGVQEDEVRCRVLVGGTLRSHKGVNFPGIDLGVGAFTERDHECLAFALEHGVDAVSQSFVQDAADIEAVKKAAADIGYNPFVVAKIERSQALEHMDAILDAADGIMVARGDLGVEIPIEEIGIVQKRLIHQANLLGKPVITATQMLESMIDNRRPTRAEVTDVCNAILDGTDCVMLSEESAMGTYPAEAVAVMSRIARATEAHRNVQPVRQVLAEEETGGDISVEDLISLSVQATVERLEPTVVITPTESGTTPRRITRFRLPVWIVAVTLREATCQRLLFSYGVHPVLESAFTKDWEAYIHEELGRYGLAKGLVILTQGPPTGKPGGTNRMEIIDLGG